MTITSKNIQSKAREYLKAKTKYGEYLLDITSEHKINYFIKIDGIEYIIPKNIFKHTIGIGNNHDGISDYILDVSKIGIYNGLKVIQPTPESLIVKTLTIIAEYIQENQKNQKNINKLITSIQYSINTIV